MWIWKSGFTFNLRENAMIKIVHQKTEKIGWSRFSWKGRAIVRMISAMTTVGITMWSLVSLLLVRFLSIILQGRLLSDIANEVLSESQCTFKHGRMTADMIFSVRTFWEKYYFCSIDKRNKRIMDEYIIRDIKLFYNKRCFLLRQGILLAYSA